MPPGVSPSVMQGRHAIEEQELRDENREEGPFHGSKLKTLREDLAVCGIAYVDDLAVGQFAQTRPATNRLGSIRQSRQRFGQRNQLLADFQCDCRATVDALGDETSDGFQIA